MAMVLLLTNDMHLSAEILPALELLPHRVHIMLAEATALLDAQAADVILLDARRDLVKARALCRLIETIARSPHCWSWSSMDGADHRLVLGSELGAEAADVDVDGAGTAEAE